MSSCETESTNPALNSATSMATFTPAVIMAPGSHLLYSTYFQARTGECSDTCLRSWSGGGILVSSGRSYLDVNTCNSLIANVIGHSEPTLLFVLFRIGKLYRGVWVGLIPTCFHNHSTRAFCEGFATT